MASNFWVLWQPPIGNVTPYFRGLVPYVPHSEFKSFRTFPATANYLRESDQSLVCLHHDDGRLSELPPPVERGHIIHGPPKIIHGPPKFALRLDAPE